MSHSKDKETSGHSEHDSIDIAAQEWFLLLTTGSATAADQDHFAMWRDADPRHRAAYEELSETWESIDDLRGAFAVSPVQATSHSTRETGTAQVDIRTRNREQRPARARHSGRHRLLKSAAAAIIAAVLIMTPELAVHIQADHVTAAGEQARALLPDGSIVWLNTNTAIAVDYDSERRTVSLLRGEAQFEVAHDTGRPFEVLARGGRSTALGTVFTVSDRGPGATVSVSEGLVEVISPAGNRDIEPDSQNRTHLSAGRGVSYREGEAPGKSHALDIAAVTAWRDGFIVIRGLRLESALAELNRYHPGWILLQADTKHLEPVTARLSIAAIDEGLEALAAIHGLAVTRIAGHLVIVH